MRILWVINVALPEASKLMNEEATPFGGWLVNSSSHIAKKINIELVIAFPKRGISENLELEGSTIKYIAFPEIENEDFDIDYINKDLDKIIEDTRPDLVHIFGTERTHSLAMINSCNEKSINSIISIQGLVSVYEKHYMANLPIEIQKRFTIRDLLKNDNLIKQKEKFSKNGRYEISAIEKSKYIIGRTTWDKTCTYQINPRAKYFHCNESLRSTFYNHMWDYDTCEEYSIFTSQASYPIKGVHFIIEALPHILKKYPKTKLYIAGNNILRQSTVNEKLRMSSYSKYIYDLINQNSLHENVVFTGLLNEEEMCDRYLKSNVFVLPSSIENSPNSLGEAMILGVPCVASYVGGTPDMIKHEEEGFLYQHDAPYMLAHYVCEIFKGNELSNKFSRNARNHALVTHNIQNNSNRMVEIYSNIISDNDK